MEKFVYYAPTEIVFGRNAEEKTAELVKKYGGSRVLLISIVRIKHIFRDPAQPGADLAIAIVAADAADSLKECLLRQLLGKIRRAGLCQQKAVYCLGMLPIDQVKILHHVHLLSINV